MLEGVSQRIKHTACSLTDLYNLCASDYVAWKKGVVKALNVYVAPPAPPVHTIRVPKRWKRHTVGFEHESEEYNVPITVSNAKSNKRNKAWNTVVCLPGFGSKAPYLLNSINQFNYGGLDVVCSELPAHNSASEFMPMFDRAIETAFFATESPLLESMQKHGRYSLLAHSTQGQTLMRFLTDENNYRRLPPGLDKVILINPFFAPAWASKAYPDFLRAMFLIYGKDTNQEEVGTSFCEFIYFGTHWLFGNISTPISDTPIARPEVMQIMKYGEKYIDDLVKLLASNRATHLKEIDFLMIRGTRDPFSCTRINKFLAETLGMQDIPIKGGHNPHADFKTMMPVFGNIFEGIYGNHHQIGPEPPMADVLANEMSV